MESNISLSPLYKLRRSLKILRCLLGFPLGVKDAGFTEFTFVPYVEFAKFIFVTLSICLTLSPNFVVLVNVRNNATELEEMQRFFKHSGLSSFDIYVAIMFIPINLISLLCHFLSFKNSCTKLSDLCQAIDKTKKQMLDFQIIQDTEQSLVTCDCYVETNNMRKITICNLACAICQTFSSYFILFNCQFGEWLSLHEKILMIISYVVFMLRFGYPLMSATAEFIITTILNDITNVFEEWSLAVERGYGDAKCSMGHASDKESRPLIRYEYSLYIY